MPCSVKRTEQGLFPGLPLFVVKEKGVEAEFPACRQIDIDRPVQGLSAAVRRQQDADKARPIQGHVESDLPFPARFARQVFRGFRQDPVGTLRQSLVVRAVQIRDLDHGSLGVSHFRQDRRRLVREGRRPEEQQPRQQQGRKLFHEILLRAFAPALGVRADLRLSRQSYASGRVRA